LSAPLVASGVELALTASIGVAAYPVDAKTSMGLLRCADIAMYESKADMTPFSRYSELMDHFTSDALAMRAELAKAIREQTLTLVYQPKLRLEDRALVGVEALARWVHPTKGPISPVKFIPLAETTELIHPFTDFVLRTAVSQIAQWMSLGFELAVAVNISANNLLDREFADKLRALLRETGVPARLVELEVTESALMRYPEVMLKRLQEIRDMGVKMSIDDFGTGFASLAYLKRLPVDALKIDKTFITNADTDEGDRRIVRSSIQLAHGFGLKVVAEGVETEVVAQMLRDAGCDLAQGFHFSRPVKASEIESAWLGRPAAEPVHG
jgi:EAL domain-containing protein (putative c-di-GMP-specific phosphodiesterase class I)